MNAYFVFALFSLFTLIFGAKKSLSVSISNENFPKNGLKVLK